jgi:hypothetical protein
MGNNRNRTDSYRLHFRIPSNRKIFGQIPKHGMQVVPNRRATALIRNNKMELIIDKSFLDGASPEEMSKLCKDYFVIMTYVLFSELMTTRDDSRRRCFSKLADSVNPVALLPEIGELLSYEIDTKRPCTPLSERCLSIKYKFHPGLRDGTFQFSEEVSEERDRLTFQFQDDAKEFADLCMLVYEFFPEINAICFPHTEFPRAVEIAKRKVACDTDFIRKVYQSFLKAQNFPSGWPNPSQISSEWAFFRWVQCKLLAALRLYQKYQGSIPPDPGIRFWTKTEHSMLDAYYIILGALTGALASAEKEMIEDFRLLSPNGIVVFPAKFSGKLLNF